ncbi:active regulator of SIRT1-like [Macrosteles quadrilineatus]|uniref:active regulator of SIRT1-like n=1 Tax=Macrosteles quadrilineatus TaxID=74068 RepID=UPI0023E2F2E0|nr:active regulator of SIRT1-like [Macrosteles quadrilineatus]
MSKSILKQSLELFGDSSADSGAKKSKPDLKKTQKSSQGNNLNFNKGLSLKKTKSVKTIDQIRKQYNKRKDHTKDNLRKLGALSKNKVNKEKTTSIFKRGSRCKEEPEMVESVQGTVFTEEDFAMFEREYVVD